MKDSEQCSGLGYKGRTSRWSRGETNPRRTHGDTVRNKVSEGTEKLRGEQTSAEDKAGVENRGEHRDRDSGDRFSDREQDNSKEDIR